MMTIREIAPLVARLGALPYFPPVTDDNARLAVAEIFASMAKDEAQVRWTVSRCLQLWDKWEGPHELRAVLCSKFKPADGVEAGSSLPQFADGIPSESEARNRELTEKPSNEISPAARLLLGDGLLREKRL